MKKNSNLLFIILLLIVTAFVAFFLSRKILYRQTGTLEPSPSTTLTTDTTLPTSSSGLEILKDDPVQLIDAEVVSIEGETLPTTIKVKAKLDKIFVKPPTSFKEVSLKADKNLIVTLFNLSNNQETPITLGDLKSFDQIVAEIVGDTNVNIIETDSYSIRKIRKIIGVPTQ